MSVGGRGAGKRRLLQLRQRNCAAQGNGDISSLQLSTICDKVMTGRPAQGERRVLAPPLNSDVRHNEVDPAACAGCWWEREA